MGIAVTPDGLIIQYDGITEDVEVEATCRCGYSWVAEYDLDDQITCPICGEEVFLAFHILSGFDADGKYIDVSKSSPMDFRTRDYRTLTRF